jgi:hypothetical protein
MSTIQQSGGMNYLQTIIVNMDSPYKLLYGFFLIIIIVYSPIISMEYRRFANSILGRVLGIGIIYGIIQTLGWVYGLLTAIAYLILVIGLPTNDTMEGFNGGGSINEKKVIGKRWFVEQVLGEHPKKIETDKVQTSAIEGISSGPMM